MSQYKFFKLVIKRCNYPNTTLSKCYSKFNISNKYVGNLCRISTVKSSYEKIAKSALYKVPFPQHKCKYLLCVSVLGWLGFIDEDETKESELIMTLKRAILCQHREQYKKAESLLHIALRLAQQQQNKRGILYTYDLMANLAFEQLELNKARTLFVDVMQRLLQDGVEEDDLKVIHVSLKLSRICHLNAESDKAEVGYRWCLDKIKKHINDPDAHMLYGVIQDWYAQFLLDSNRIDESLIHLKEAYKVCCELKGNANPESLLLLNDLGTTSWRAGDLTSAERFLREAADMGKKIDDQTHLGVVHANLGLICLEKGITGDAQRYCKEAWHLGKRHENVESIEQANYCFEQIKLVLGK